MARIVAINKVNAVYITESPANTLRGLESQPDLGLAKKDFADQAAIDTYVTARGGNTSMWVALTLPAGYAGP